MTATLTTTEPPGPIAAMAGNSVAANLLMLLCLVGGFVALRNTKQEVFPEITTDAVQIVVVYPGASPEDVEQGIILAAEEAVRGLDGVDEISATASEGRGTVTVELLLGTDAQRVAQEIKSEIDRITTFPEEAEEPQVSIVSRRREVLTLVLHGDLETRVLHQLGERVRDQLLQDPDITQVELTGVPPLEIGIAIPEEHLRRYGITLEEVARRLRDASLDLPGGGLKTASGEILVRVKERRDYGREFAELPIITTAEGARVLLGEIATIDDGYEDADRYTRFDGQCAVILEVYRIGNQTPIQVADAVRRQLEEIAAELPPGVQTAIEQDRSDIYRQRVELLLRNGAIGLVLVLVLLGLFLEARLAFWVMMGIPISFLGSFLVLPLTGVSINMISLFAYIIALGIVVDDAVVVGENVYHHMQEGMGLLDAAIRGAREVAWPVTFSILTNCVTFMPLLLIPGMTGRIFKMIPVVVCTAFIISLGESLFILPAHLSHTRQRQRRGLSAWLHARQQGFSHAFRHWVRVRYGAFLDLCLRHRYLTIAVAIGLLVLVLSYAASGRMGFGLFPTVESDYSEARLVLPYGAPVERTEAITQRLVAGARQVATDIGHPELVEGIIAEIGESGGHSGRVRVMLAAAEVRDRVMSTQVFTDRWREAVGEVPGVESLRFLADAGGPGSRGRVLTVELSHRDLETLELASSELAESLASYPRVRDVDDGFQPGKVQLDFAIRPEGRSLGLSGRDVARQVRSALYGAQVVRQQRGRNELKIMVRLPEEERASRHAVNEWMVRTPAGPYVPLKEIAALQPGRAHTAINRRNGRRVVQVSADVSPRSKAGDVLDDLELSVLPDLMREYRGLQYSFEGQRADIRESLQSLRTTFLMAMMIVYVLLAIAFRSYSQPLIIMTSIPFGVVGAILGHLLMGFDLCIPSMLGMVALSGVVLNDSLILIDFANRREREGGLSPEEAIHDAVLQRFRPVLLTTLTTFGGLAPMIFETSRQARFLIPMALSLGFGILFATVITLLIVPSLFLVAEDSRKTMTRLASLV